MADATDMSTPVTRGELRAEVIDEKYADLPLRVSRLEGKTFPPERR
jgi:hypothetical protein